MTRQSGSDDDLEAPLVPLGMVLEAIDEGAPAAAREVAEEILRTGTRALPQALDAERALLGCALLDPRTVDEVAELVSAADFHAPAHAIVWATVTDMRFAGEPVDTVTVVDRLQRDGRLDEAGGAAAVSRLEGMLASPAHAPSYARAVREKSQLRAVIAAARRMTEAAYRADRRASDVVDEAERDVFALGQASTSGLTYANRRAEITNILDTLGQDDPGTLATGLSDLDVTLGGGVKPGQLIVVGARPSVGKSAFAHALLARLADQHDAPSCFYSMEMPAADLLRRELAMRSGVPLASFRKPTREQESKLARAAGEIETRPIRIVDRGTLGVGEIVSHARRAVARDGITTIVVDHLQIMSGIRAQYGVADLEAITKRLKALALDAKITVVLLSQLNRESEKRNDKRPTLADLRGSGGTEQDADVVLLLHRPEMAHGDKCAPERRGICEVIVAKNRNGPLGVVDLAYHGPTFRFALPSKSSIYDPRDVDDRRAGYDT